MLFWLCPMEISTILTPAFLKFSGEKKMKEARLYEKLDGGEVRCHLCRHRCKIKADHRGLSAVRLNQGETIVHAWFMTRITPTNVDPIEKKPFFHFAPGSKSFSIATVGCNFFCSFCQNYSISQMPHDMNRIVGDEYSPKELVSMALATDCKSVAYTFTPSPRSSMNWRVTP